MNNKTILAIAGGVVLLLAGILIWNSYSLVSTTDNGNSVSYINPSVDNTGVVNPNPGNEVPPEGSNITIPDAEKQGHEPANLLPEDKVRAAAEAFIRKYYDFNDSNYKTYYGSLAPLTTPAALQTIKNGAPGLYFGALTEADAFDVAVTTGFFSRFKKIVKFEITENDNYAAGTEITVQYTIPPIDFEEASFPDNLVLVQDKMFVHVDKDYKVDIVSFVSEGDILNGN